ncbi:energy-coupling factor ABC transporter ATP-binding protein [Kribbia dieselivorans]|uniref:energy-coupling factor ABC transporter ATP-binding protein n=1 Tax=Kribbia dieselivorans TaxID=331526 RepID=UPI001FE21143|nr:ATP-binding cassette domain-containing protein [Kribbia dieselivorans]
MTGDVGATGGRGEVLALEATALRVDYPGAPRVLDDLTFRVRRGVRMAILGANGSGKSTLLRSLSGSLTPATGEIAADGVLLRHRRKDLDLHRRRVQLVLQDPDDQLFSADVFTDVAFGPVNLGLSDDEVRWRVAECLASLGIADLVDRPVHHLSYGQRKRVALAGALAMGPSTLLLDEPTAGLDPSSSESLVRVLDGLTRSGVTIVMSTHDVDLAWRWADEVAVLIDARVMQGSPGDLLSDASLLRRTCLSRPWQAAMLQEAGVAWGADGERPRSVVEVLAALGVRGGV